MAGAGMGRTIQRAAMPVDPLPKRMAVDDLARSDLRSLAYLAQSSGGPFDITGNVDLGAVDAAARVYMETAARAQAMKDAGKVVRPSDAADRLRLDADPMKTGVHPEESILVLGPAGRELAGLRRALARGARADVGEPPVGLLTPEVLGQLGEAMNRVASQYAQGNRPTFDVEALRGTPLAEGHLTVNPRDHADDSEVGRLMAELKGKGLGRVRRPDALLRTGDGRYLAVDDKFHSSAMDTFDPGQAADYAEFNRYYSDVKHTGLPPNLRGDDLRRQPGYVEKMAEYQKEIVDRGKKVPVRRLRAVTVHAREEQAKRKLDQMGDRMDQPRETRRGIVDKARPAKVRRMSEP